MGCESGFRIRPWVPADREKVQDLLRLLSQEADVTTEEAPTFVAESSEGIVGMVTLCVFTTLTGPKAYLDHLVVAPERRRQGIGRSLVLHAIEIARQAQASRIDLSASETKQAGRALYAALGFSRRDSDSFRLHLDRGSPR